MSLGKRMGIGAAIGAGAGLFWALANTGILTCEADGGCDEAVPRAVGFIAVGTGLARGAGWLFAQVVG